MNKYNDDKTFLPVMIFASFCIEVNVIALFYKLIMNI